MRRGVHPQGEWSARWVCRPACGFWEVAVLVFACIWEGLPWFGHSIPYPLFGGWKIKSMLTPWILRIFLEGVDDPDGIVNGDLSVKAGEGDLAAVDT